MRSKPVQWLMAAALLSTIAIPGWAQPELVGGEFKVNQNDSRQLSPQVASSPSGNSLIVWQNDLHGIQGRAFDRNGNPTTPPGLTATWGRRWKWVVVALTRKRWPSGAPWAEKRWPYTSCSRISRRR